MARTLERERTGGEGRPTTETESETGSGERTASRSEREREDCPECAGPLRAERSRGEVLYDDCGLVVDEGADRSRPRVARFQRGRTRSPVTGRPGRDADASRRRALDDDRLAQRGRERAGAFGRKARPGRATARVATASTDLGDRRANPAGGPRRDPPDGFRARRPAIGPGGRRRAPAPGGRSRPAARPIGRGDCKRGALCGLPARRSPAKSRRGHPCLAGRPDRDRPGVSVSRPGTRHRDRAGRPAGVPASLLLGFRSPRGGAAKGEEIVRAAGEDGLLSGRSPTGCAAAAIYAASLLCEERRSQSAIAEVADVTEVTIRNHYREFLAAVGALDV